MKYLGTAGWSIPKSEVGRFSSAGATLTRYASVFNCVEINSTFKHSHQDKTFDRWAGSVPDGFKFAVKSPKSITHDRRLVDCSVVLADFLKSVSLFGSKLGPLLFQLPPSLAFELDVATAFFQHLRQETGAEIACEPRHESWFGAEAEEMFGSLGVARVAADPAVVPAAAVPGGSANLAYIRLHGSPQTYYSSYSISDVEMLAAMVRALSTSTWCIFDNTASGAATANALQLAALIDEKSMS